MQTDDMVSEEEDIFERVRKFEELQRRLAEHKKNAWKMRGNDLRYNIYLKKINKLTRMDLGLDVLAYKDYVQNLTVFAKYNKDYEILADDHIDNKISGGLNTIFETNETRLN